MATDVGRRVAVVHGRDQLARDAVFAFLRDIGLQAVEWDQAVAATGRGTPTNIETVGALLDSIQAVVVVMTPDDEARLRHDLRHSDDPRYEFELTGQPRQNVLIEAGMAFGKYPERTILIEIGAIRPASDFAGMNIIRIDGTNPAPVQRLASRLQTAGCEVDYRGSDWLKLDRFKAVSQRPMLEQSGYSSPLLRPNYRGTLPLSTCGDIGLVDVDYRREAGNVVTPTQFYAASRRELAIAAVSAYQTLTQHIHVLVDLLNRGRKLCLLLLDPDAEDVRLIVQREKHPVDRDIRASIEIVKAHGLTSHAGFQARFGTRLPPFTATMIDGDIGADSHVPIDADGQIRVQPGVVHGTLHEGPILQFAKVAGAGGFDYFGGDLRAQWRVARQLPDLFA